MSAVSAQVIPTHKPFSSLSQHRGALLGSATSPDAELLALGREFDALHAQFLFLFTTEQELEVRYLAAKDEISGLLDDGQISPAEAMDRLGEAETLTGWGAASAATDMIVGDMDPIAWEIKEAKAHSLAGMIVKARVAKWAWTYTCGKYLAQPENELDWEDRFAIDLIESVLALEEAQTIN